MKRYFVHAIILCFTLFMVMTGLCCGKPPGSLEIKDVSYLIKKGDDIRLEEENNLFYDALLSYYQRCLYMHDGNAYTKWYFEAGTFHCKWRIEKKDLYPQEYVDDNQIIDYIKHYETNLISADKRFISIINTRDAYSFYIWNLEDSALHHIKTHSPIRKIQWSDKQTVLHLLTQNNTLYSIEPFNLRSQSISIAPGIPKEAAKIQLVGDGVIYLDKTSVFLANREAEPLQIVDSVAGLLGTYQNTLIVQRLNGKLEAGSIDRDWKPFFTDKVNYCKLVTGRNLAFYKTSDHSQVTILDLATGTIFDYDTLGHGYMPAPDRNAIVYFDNQGIPYASSNGRSCGQLQAGAGEPFENHENILVTLSRRDGGGIWVEMFSVEEKEWRQITITAREG